MDELSEPLGFSLSNDLHELLFESAGSLSWFSPNNAGSEASMIIGDPHGATEFWKYQDTDFTCAVVSQQMILAKYGIHVSEAQLVYDATINGWLTDNGTTPADLGRLLEYYGVDTRTNFGGGPEAIAAELARGHKVIVGVDSSVMHGGNPFWERILGTYGADHAIVVTGLDMSDPGSPMVYVNDPGDPYGAGKAYPLEDFLKAWDASGQLYVSTTTPPPGLATDSMFGSNFDAESGWYMNPDYWIRFLDQVFAGVLVAYSAVEAWQMASDYWSNGAAQSEAAWANLSDSARNNLFLSI